jgi:hypothetical protein
MYASNLEGYISGAENGFLLEIMRWKFPANASGMSDG